MKNFIKIFGIITFVAIIGFSMTVCDNGPGSSNSGTASTDFESCTV